MSGDSGHKDEPGQSRPPRAPQIKREFKLHPYQKVGLPFLLFVPFVALLGLLDEKFDTSEGRSVDITLQVRYPSRFRYPTRTELQVYVRNATATTLDTLTVRIDRDYLEQFVNVQIVPDASEIGEIELMNMAPGEERRISVELEGRHYWKHRGTITAVSRGLQPALAEVSTFVFP